MISGSFARLAAAGVAAFLLGLGTRAKADEAPRITGVVELFTSQGCYSCPPADAVLRELGNRPDLVTLAYHVDYWNYLGWRDTLGRQENTERQRAYMQALNSRSVYTPQAIVNGRVEMNGANRESLLRTLKEMALAGAGVSVPVAAWATSDGFAIEAGAPAPADDPDPNGAGKTNPDKAYLLLVSFRAPQAVAIPTGENEGKTITYWNPVSGVQSVGLWHGKPVRFELPASALPRGEGGVALLQEVDAQGLPGPILGAAVLRQPSH